MDIRRRGSQQGTSHTDKPVRTASDNQKQTPSTAKEPVQDNRFFLPPAELPKTKLAIKQAEEILAHPAAEPEKTKTPDINTVSQGTNETIKTIEIKIVLPALLSLSKAVELSEPIRPVYHHVKQQVAKTSKKARLITGASMLTTLALVVGYTQFFSTDATVVADTQTTTGRPATLPAGTPEYATLLPASKSIDELGGWRRLSPPDKDPVFVYVDAIGSTSISVSQQPLPDDFKNDTVEKVRLLAADFNANEKITLGSTTVFIGKSAEGPQSVIFYKNNLLIFMKSRGEINNAQWADYIKELK